jgi:hypothetical protein
MRLNKSQITIRIDSTLTGFFDTKKDFLDRHAASILLYLHLLSIISFIISSEEFNAALIINYSAHQHYFHFDHLFAALNLHSGAQNITRKICCDTHQIIFGPVEESGD